MFVIKTSCDFLGLVFLPKFYMNLRCGASAPGVHLWKKWEPVEGTYLKIGWELGGGRKAQILFDKFGRFGLREEAMVGEKEGLQVFAFGIELTPEIASSKKLHTWREASQFGPWHLVSCKGGHVDVPKFCDLSGPQFRLPRLFWALPWVILGRCSGCQG